jgi:hypothetical protein
MCSLKCRDRCKPSHNTSLSFSGVAAGGAQARKAMKYSYPPLNIDSSYVICYTLRIKAPGRKAVVVLSFYIKSAIPGLDEDYRRGDTDANTSYYR